GTVFTGCAALLERVDSPHHSQSTGLEDAHLSSSRLTLTRRAPMSETISARFCPHCLAPMRATDRACRVCGWRIADTLEALPASPWSEPLAAGRVQPEPLLPILTSGPAPHLPPPSPLPAAARSRKLLVSVIALAIFPLCCPFHFMASPCCGSGRSSR